ncbi:MAG: hypothetical protein K2G08_04535, partial [Paramuribaculum sp.]|nr:hypothetical protein [Paramuribaculum sp.]
MADWHSPQGPFDIPEVPDYIPRRLKPYLFILFVLIVQFSGGLYLAAASDMVGTTALMQEDILMAGYASLIGLAINFAVMFRIKFRFSTRAQLLASAAVLIAANLICAHTTSVPLLVATCFVAGWFRMQATLACNSTIQLWLTPVRDMAIFFCYVYIIVDSVIQLSGIATVYTAFFSQWEYMHWTMTGLLALMMIMVMILVRPMRGPMFIPLLGIDWIGAALWAGFMMCFTFICVYGNYFDWWHAVEIRGAALIGLACLCINLWRASFLRHPYISFQAMKNRNVIRATVIYLIFFTLIATEHVFEHSYAATILGFDETNLIDLNWYVFAGIIAGCAFTYFTFALRKWRYKTMTAVAFALAIVYLAYFYFFIDYSVEKEMLFIPLFFRGAAAVIISIVFLTSIVQSGLSFQVFPQALTINGFTGAVMGATLGPAIIGELLRHTMAKNAALLSTNISNTNPEVAFAPIGQLYGLVQT